MCLACDVSLWRSLGVSRHVCCERADLRDGTDAEALKHYTFNTKRETDRIIITPHSIPQFLVYPTMSLLCNVSNC